MDRAFWLDRWQREEIGFHLPEANPKLLAHWPSLNCDPPAEVFVPLCGKTRDMLWLAEQGYTVTGVELSPLAVEGFFADNGLEARRESCGAFERWHADRISILLGDFFDLTPQDLQHTAAVYDRASLIAMPEPLRLRYAEHLQRLLPRTAPVLLITMEYPQHEMEGPPFSVHPQEVQQLYGAQYNVECLDRDDIWAQTPRFQDKGLTALNETVYRLVPR